MPKLLYGVPNFREPSGVSFTAVPAARRWHSAWLPTELLMVEDDPCKAKGAALRREHLPPPSPSWLQYSAARLLLQDGGARVPPGLDAGAGLAAQKVTIAKQATDLHSNAFEAGAAPLPDRSNSLDAHLEDQGGLPAASVPPWDRPGPSLPARRQLRTRPGACSSG